MNSWFRAIRLGDACRFGKTDYRVQGRLACLQADSSFWQELLLTPTDVSPAQAIESRRALWLAWEPDIGGLSWTPIELPAGIVPGELDQLQRLNYGGRLYRRQERDHYQVSQVEGDLAGDVRSGERVQYVELLSGSERLCLEWGESGLDAYVGRRLTAIDLRDGFREAGVRLDMRAANDSLSQVRGTAKSARQARQDSDEVSESLQANVVMYAIAFVIAIPLILMDGCSPDCRQQTNPQTGKTEYACSDGSVRSSRPWFGK